MVKLTLSSKSKEAQTKHPLFRYALQTKLDTTKNIIIGSPYSFSIGLTGDYELAKYFELVAGKPIAGPDGTVGGIIIVTKSDGMEKMALLNYHDVGDVFEGVSFEDN